MCGIAGIFGSPPSALESSLESLNSAQRRRGPDAQGIWISGDRRIGLAHVRLAIIDLSPAGSQPMRSRTGRYITVFNGEIYNFAELKEELTHRGHTFEGHSDTEVLLAAVEQWGPTGAVERFDGMFALALVDTAERQLILMRDRLGVKPLYYQWHAGSIYFSSELTAPFAAVCGRSIDRQALVQFLELNYVPAPATIYEGVHKLMPGVAAFVTYESAGQGSFSRTHTYWDTAREIEKQLSQTNGEMTRAEALDLLNETLRQVIRRRMISDVPLGAFLSGGIDSSLVVAHMQALSSTPVRTFTIGMNDDANDESAHAREIARHLGTSHTELMISEADAMQVVPDIPALYGEPFADSSQIPTYLVSRLARSEVTVALSGDAADELFAGYRSYQSALKLEPLARSLPQPVASLILRSVRGGAGRQIATAMTDAGRAGAAVEYLSLMTGNGARGASGNLTERAMCRDLSRYLPDDILTKVDRASMAVSLEVRTPFADSVELFRTAWRIPFRHKIHRGRGKAILRDALAQFVPPALFERPKHGFTVPLARWLSGGLRPWMEDTVATIRRGGGSLLELREVERARRLALTGNDFFAYKLWGICVFQTWLTSRGIHAT